MVVTDFAPTLVAFATITAVEWPLVANTSHGVTGAPMSNNSPEKQPSGRDPEHVRVGQIIQEWRDDRRYSRTALANEVRKRGVRLSPGYLAKLELGDKGFANANLAIREAIREVLQISPQEWRDKTGLFVPLAPGEVVPGGNVQLLTRDIHAEMRTIPVFDLLSAGPGGDGGTIVEYIDIPETWKGEYAAYQVTGDSMSPHIPDKAKIVVRSQDHSEPGDIIACYAGDHGNVVKVLRGVSEDGTVTLTSLNPNYPPIWAPYVHVFGVVVEIRTPPPVIDRNGNGKHRKTN